MLSPERNISAVDQRLVTLEDEATRLRAEVAALQDEIRWLTGQDDEPTGWLSRGWVRASLLLTAVGMVALVSLPYLVRFEPPGPDAGPVAGAASASRPTAVAPRPAATPAPVKAAAGDALPAPVAAQVRAAEAPEPARVLSTDDRSGVAPRPRPVRERRALRPSDAILAAPARGESP